MCLTEKNHHKLFIEEIYSHYNYFFFVSDTWKLKLFSFATTWGKTVVCQNAIVVLDVQDVWRAYGALANVSTQVLQIFHFTSFHWTMN
jgi:hypothetical protein